MKKLILISALIVLSSCNKVKQKFYVAKLSQSGVEAPIAKILDDKKIKIIWSRSAEGIYFGDFSGVDFEKVSVNISNPANINGSISYSLNENQIQIYTSKFTQDNGGFSLSDDVLINIDFTLTEFK
jgi:hypothetical protein